jgi:hypothetical protein
MLSATTQGLRDLGQFKKRVAHDYGRRQLTKVDFDYISDRIEEIESKLIEIISGDSRRIDEDQRSA